MARLHQRTTEPVKRFLIKAKPRSTAWRTTLLVSGVSLFSLLMSLTFFWRTLYLPELRHHARYLAIELDLLHEAEMQMDIDPFAVSLHDWILGSMGVQIVRNPEDFPDPREKFIADFFTNTLEKELKRELGEEVTVYFKFKPSPELWIQYPSLGQAWIREPLYFYGEYSLELILAWLLGIPLMTLIITLTLVRQINRPLARLQSAAQLYSRKGSAPDLQTDTGPIEIRQVNAAFNHMIATLQQAAQERMIMLAGISHDLRTPLTRMRLTAELMPDEDLREGLIYDVDDMDGILEQFISYMKDGSDEAAQDTDINQILQELIIQYKPLKIIYQPQSLPKIQIRSLSIKRMIGNLINNARRYGAEPLYLAASLIGGKIVITVRDAGQGIQAEQVNDLMQPFVRGDAARSTQGSGLGLAIVQRIAELHGGAVELRNHPDGGLEVTVSLPLHPEDSDEPRLAATSPRTSH